MLCKHCSYPLPDGVRYCDRCGAPQFQPPRPKRRGLYFSLFSGGVALLVCLALILVPMLRATSPNGGIPTGGAAASTLCPTPTQGEERVQLQVQEAQLEYTLTDGQVEEYYDLLNQFKSLSLNTDNSKEVQALYDAVEEQYCILYSQRAISQALYYTDTTDEAMQTQYLQCSEILTAAYDEYMQVMRQLYSSDTVHKDIIFEDWTEAELRLLELYTSEVADLQQVNSELEVQYQSLSDQTMATEMVPIYLQLVENNNRIAQIYGYQNYYEYGYEQVYERDFGLQEVQTMRTYAAKYLPNALEGALNAFLSGRNRLPDRELAQVSRIMEEYSQDDIEGYLSTLPQGMRDNMVKMWDGDILQMENAYNALEGAFTTALSDERSICFFGPGYGNTLTYMHEVGHYYGACHIPLDDIPLDLAETHSQSNEFLFMSYAGRQISSTARQNLMDYRLYSDLCMLLVCLMVDEFEQMVYSHPDPGSLTGQELDAIMEEVCQRYGGIDFVTYNVTDIQHYWRLVVVEQPVYYISYATSSVASMGLYFVAEQNYYQAVEIYRTLIEETDEQAGFLAAITGAGLSGPFEESFYQKIAQRYS